MVHTCTHMFRKRQHSYAAIDTCGTARYCSLSEVATHHRADCARIIAHASRTRAANHAHRMYTIRVHSLVQRTHQHSLYECKHVRLPSNWSAHCTCAVLVLYLHMSGCLLPHYLLASFSSVDQLFTIFFRMILIHFLDDHFLQP